MKLSEELQQLHDCGDVGRAVEGLAEKAALLEIRADLLSQALEYALRNLSKGSLSVVSSFVDEITKP